VARPSATRCTLEDVAARSGVSRATVSRVVNGSTRVSDGARAAVERAIEQLGYAPNRAARSLAAHRSDTVALAVSEPSTRLFGDPFFAGTIRGIAATLCGSRYQLVLLMIQDESDREGVERLLLRGNTDGVLLLSTRRDDPLPGRLVAARIPCVIAGHPGDRPDASAIGFVDADNIVGARRACAHLIRLGCRTIATVAGPLDMAPGADRLAGWRRALGEARRPAPSSLVAEGDFSRASAAAGALELLERHPDVDGIFAASDLMALGTLDALRAAGRSVPDDVALVGFDDSELAADADPPLTTVRQPIEALGAEMGRLLLEQLGGAAPRGVTLETELVVRRSA
jgi:DNA-binding LacI/PurR family transcriptional regulator